MTAPRQRLSPIERLARDIAWAEWIDPGNPSRTKFTYWVSLPPDDRFAYVKEATRFTWLIHLLGAPTIAKILAETCS